MAVRVTGKVAPNRYSELNLPKNLLIDMFWRMTMIRQFEERVWGLFTSKRIPAGTTHSSVGQEAVSVGIMEALGKKDSIVSNYRGHGHAIARGVPPEKLMAEILGRATGTCSGVSGSMHSAKYQELGIMYASAIVGSGIPIAVGIALALSIWKEKGVSVVFFGDGAANTGSFHEGCNMAAIWKLPLVMVCENNMYAHSTRVDRTTAGQGIAHRANAYGMEGVIADGNDVVSVYASARDAVEAARNGGGPSLLECRTYRMMPHNPKDNDRLYRNEEEIEEWSRKDPISTLRTNLLSARLTDSNELHDIETEVGVIMDKALDFAFDSPLQSLSNAAGFVY